MTQTFSSTGRDTFVGSPRSRIDGPAKVTGHAKYAGEFAAPDLTHGNVVSSPAPRGATRTSRTRWRPPARRSAPSTTT